MGGAPEAGAFAQFGVVGRGGWVGGEGAEDPPGGLAEPGVLVEPGVGAQPVEGAVDGAPVGAAAFLEVDEGGGDDVGGTEAGAVGAQAR